MGGGGAAKRAGLKAEEGEGKAISCLHPTRPVQSITGLLVTLTVGVILKVRQN